MARAFPYLRRLVVAATLILACLSAMESRAQSSVRPPASAVGQPSAPASGPEFTAPLGSDSDSDIWRYLKEGSPGAPTHLPGTVPPPSAPGHVRTMVDTFLAEINAPDTSATSQTGQARVMQVLGEEWRLIRRTYVLPYAGWAILGVVGALALFFLVRGRVRIAAGRSGKTIPRFSMSHRIAHWFLASTFILMALSGLIILLGRPLLVPLIGKEANAVLTSAAMQGHNLFGPVFILSLLIVIVRFVRGNFFQWADVMWILKGGGVLGIHAHANHYNFGEKAWYWIVVFVGLTMSATGLLLLFPWVTDTLAWLQLATLLHDAGAILMISVALGHAYIGSIGMEGALDSMLLGEVDENWAKEHHDLWYEQMTGKPAHSDDDGPAPDSAAAAEGAT